LIDDRLSPHVGRKRFTAIEGGPIGQAGGKGIGLVLIASDQNSSHDSFCAS
jgi:hypothetical protein